MMRAAIIGVALLVGVVIGQQLRSDAGRAEVDRAGASSANPDSEPTGAQMEEALPAVENERICEFDVRLPNGDQPDVARITVTTDENARTLRWTPKRGAVRLAAVDSDIRAESDSLRSPSVFVGAGDEPGTIRLVLAARPGMHGRILTPAGWTPARIWLNIGHAENYKKPADFARLRAARRSPSAPEYRYEVKDLEPGSYVVAVSLDGRTADKHVVVEVTDRPIEKDLVFDSFARPHHREVVVLGPDGVGVTGARFWVYAKTDRTINMGGPGFDFGGGRYLIQCPDTLERATERSLTVQTDQYGKIVAPGAPAGTEGVTTVRYPPPGLLDVVVEGFATSPHAPYLRIDLRLPGSGPRSSLSRPSGIDVRGVRRFAAVRPGKVLLTLELVDGWQMRAIARRKLEVHSGANEVRFAIPTLHPLRIECAKPTDAGTISLQLLTPDALRFARQFELPKSGAIEFTRLVTGTYELAGATDGRIWRRRFNIPDTPLLRVTR